MLMYMTAVSSPQELVKDEWQEGGKKHTRWRYLAYDLVCLSGKAFHKYSYLQRLDSLYREVIGPRDRLKVGSLGCLNSLLPCVPFEQ